jgi:hypothetical protein
MSFICESVVRLGGSSRGVSSGSAAIPRVAGTHRGDVLFRRRSTQCRGGKVLRACAPLHIGTRGPFIHRQMRDASSLERPTGTQRPEGPTGRPPYMRPPPYHCQRRVGEGLTTMHRGHTMADPLRYVSMVLRNLVMTVWNSARRSLLTLYLSPISFSIPSM